MRKAYSLQIFDEYILGYQYLFFFLLLKVVVDQQCDFKSHLQYELLINQFKYLFHNDLDYRHSGQVHFSQFTIQSLKYLSNNHQDTQMYQTSQANLKNRRSVSLLSQQNSKRSSMSVLNIQDSILNSQQQQPSFQIGGKPNEKNETLWDDLLPALKNKLIESYRVVRNHVKTKNYMFSQVELSEVYQGMSNGLKTLQKTVECALRIKNELSKRQCPVNAFTSSYKMLKPQSEQLYKYPHLICQTSDIPEYANRIECLQSQLEQIKQKHNQQIRMMIQNHEQEMMYVESEQNSKISNMRKEHQQQVESMLQAHKKRQEDIKNESSRKVNQIVKAKFENLKLQQLAKFQQLINDHQLKQTKYKGLIKRLTEKLTSAKTAYQNLQKQLDDNRSKTKSLLQRLIKSQPHQPKNDSYLKILAQKLTSLLLQDPIDQTKFNQTKPPVSYANPAPFSYQTMAIDQMFMKSDQSMLENNFQNSLENIIQQLITWNFFSQDNQENVSNLFNIARQQSDTCHNPSAILSHTLYPLILQKIKLALTRIQAQCPKSNLKDSLTQMSNSQHPAPIAQFSTSNMIKLQNPNIFPIRYRNIQSIDELEVSDSMICDENNEDKEKRIFGMGNFENHSPIINYKGYETREECDQSASFDVDLF